jgi:adenylate kinase family enzyme
MRIIIDGNDGVGKTTLAKRLRHDLDIKSLIHLSYNDPRDYNFYSTILKKTDVIFDRSFIDEPIYSFVLNRKAEFDINEELKLYNLLKELKYTVIICHTPEKIVKANEIKDIVAKETIIDEYFEKVAKENGFLYFDPMNDNYDQLLEWLTR